jgi:hypothetical protein
MSTAVNIADIDLPAFAERFELDLDGLKRVSTMKEFFAFMDENSDLTDHDDIECRIRREFLKTAPVETGWRLSPAWRLLILSRKNPPRCPAAARGCGCSTR